MATLLDLEKQKFNSSGEIKVSGDFAVAGQTDYSTSDITALGSSTNINDWVSAFHDGQLTYKYVQEYNGTQEKVAYFTHPSLGNGNKCLRLFKLYSTQNSVLVLQGVKASIVDWTFDANIQGTVSITLGTITSPAANAAAGTDVCSVTITNTGSGSNTLSLSGANASLYQLNNTTQGQTGSTLSNVLTTDTVVIETASDFTNVTYSHSLTVTITESNFNLSAYQNISTSGTEVTATFANEFFAGASGSTAAGADYQLNTSGQSTVEKSLWPSLGNGTNKFPLGADDWSISFYIRFNTTTNTSSEIDIIKVDSGTVYNNIKLYRYGNAWFYIYFREDSTKFMRKYYGINGIGGFDTWTHLVVTKAANSGDTSAFNLYVNGSLQSPNGTLNNGVGTGATPYTDAATVDQVYINSSKNHTAPFTHLRLSGGNDIDNVIGWNKELSASEVGSVYNSGTVVDPDDLSFSSSVDSHFTFGDGPDDSVTNKQGYDLKDNERYFEIANNNSQVFGQYTMNDSPYLSASGNHKYISDTYRGSASNYTVGNYNRDSSSDKVGFFPDLDSTTDFRSSNNVSYSFWLQPSNTTSDFKNIFTENYFSSSSYQAFFMVFTYGTELRLYAAYNGNRRIKTYSTSLSQGTWSHIVVTTNTSDVVDGATVYFNGVALSETGSDVSPTIDRSGASVRALCLGGRIPDKDHPSGTLGTLPATGDIRLDEFSTWKKTLTASEVTEIFNSGLPTNLSNHSAASDLQRWFRFGDTTGDGTAIKDSLSTTIELTSFDSQNNIQNH